MKAFCAAALCVLFCVELSSSTPVPATEKTKLAEESNGAGGMSLLERIAGIEAAVHKTASSWQSLHIAAASSCRAITGTGGSGSSVNVVYPRTTRNTCLQVCQRSPYKNCDGSLTIMGTHARATAANQPVGYFYNYGCKSAGGGLHETDGDRDLTKETNIIGYCCCRK